MTIQTNFRKAFMSEIVEHLRSTNSKLAKQEILETAIQTKPYFKEFLNAVYNPFITYHIKKIPAYRDKNGGGRSIESILKKKELNQLSERRKTGHAAELYLMGLFEDLNEFDKEALKMIINRDLKAGVNISTINKAAPGLIPSYPCMLASKYTDKNMNEMEFPAFSQLKADGLRCNIIVRYHSGQTIVETFGRSGKNLNLEHLFDGFTQAFQNTVFDGEIIVFDVKADKYLPRKAANGIINKYAQKKIKADDAERYIPHFFAWDVIAYENFSTIPKGETKQVWHMPYHKRWKLLEGFLKFLHTQQPEYEKTVHLIENRIVDNVSEVQEHFKSITGQGLEGIVLKSRNNIWCNTRPNDQIKFKLEKDCDLKIVDMIEGKGKYAKKLGALLCESKDGGLCVSVGSGFSDEQRANLWNEKLIGQIVEVKYNELIDSKGRDEKSLFLPIFVDLRNDKTEADLTEEIN